MRKVTLVSAVAMCGAAIAADMATATADFASQIGAIRPALHSSGWTPRISSRGIAKDDKLVSAMNMAYTRTHDWALVNSGQRIIDYQYIFPLFHLDAKDPANYVFGPSDHIIGLARDIGLDIFYRLGTSIEHSGDVHFNALVPPDFEKTAEIFAGIMRHYNKGWANGHEWNIKYWEIWNEPDGIRNMWCLPESEGGKNPSKMRKLFFKFFITCLKRLKQEFPGEKIGGPALTSMQEPYFRGFLSECKKAGAVPDFISWHYYGADPDAMLAKATVARKMCDELGLEKCELILNEWHYRGCSWSDLRSTDPEVRKRVWEGPASHNGIDSACFTLASLIKFQTSPLDQAYYYGCAPIGTWGYMGHDGYLNKNWYACKLFGEVVRDYSPMFATSSSKASVSLLAAKAKDGKSACLLVNDYKGGAGAITVDVKGLGDVEKTSATILDHTHKLTPAKVSFADGRLTLAKNDDNSACWFVKFNLK